MILHDHLASGRNVNGGISVSASLSAKQGDSPQKKGLFPGVVMRLFILLKNSDGIF
jgi:hypothetical protein